jgi:hypothetical protein
VSATTTELPGLLRGCVKWRDGRAWVDNDALLVVADWCEENDRLDDAEPIREAMGWGDAALHAGYCICWGRGLDEDTFLNCGNVVLEAGTPDLPLARAYSWWDAHPLARPATYYWLTPDETPAPTGRRSRRQIPHKQEALNRIRDLARWDLICHMLGYPPLRLLGEE